MIECRCNICGDICPDDDDLEMFVSLDKTHRIRVAINIDLQESDECEKRKKYDKKNGYDAAFSTTYFLGLYGNKQEDESDFHTCFGCAAHLVAVAYDQYVKKVAHP